jgi:hypothetical protein
MTLKFERFHRRIQGQRREIVPGPTLGFPFSVSSHRFSTYLRRARSLLRRGTVVVRRHGYAWVRLRGEAVAVVGDMKLHRCRCHQDRMTSWTARLLQPTQGEAVVVVGYPSRSSNGRCVTRVTRVTCLRSAPESSCLCNPCAR